ncbi:MAG: ATP-binding cassette domain-containing protein [Actinomycetota bacterium]
MNGLAVSGLHKRFGDLVALDGVSLGVEPGAMVGFLGPNGAGKSTTMRSIMRLIGLDQGTVTWNGAPIDESTRRRFGYMPQERGVYERMRLHEQIVYFGRLAGLDESEASTRAGRLLERVGLDGRRDDEVQELSTGNKQRVQLCVALVHDPVLLILDEPFAGLDPLAVDTLREIIVEQTERGTAVVFSSHQLDLVQDLCRHVTIIDHGRTIADGDVDDIRAGSQRRHLRIEWADPSPATDAWQPLIDHAAPSAADGNALAGGDGTLRRTTHAVLDADADPAALMSSASRAGRVASFRFEPPSLDDAFTELLRR